MTGAYKIVAETSGGSDVLSRQPLVIPQPGRGELLLRHTAIGLNFVDVYFRSGLYPWPTERDLVLGCEGAGVIEKVGPGVTGFSEGDRVAYTTAHDAYQTHRILPATVAIKLPESISDEQAAGAMLKGLTAHYLLHHSYPVESGETVLYHAAAGGVGLIAGQWLNAKGVRAIGTAGGARKCELAAANGFDTVIDYTSEDFVERVADATSGKGVAAVYDSIGKDTNAGSLKCLQKFGTLVCFGQASGSYDAFQINDLSAGSFRLTRPILFHFTSDREWLERATADLFEMISSGQIKIAINQSYGLEDVPKAHDDLEARQTTGCTLLVP